jgi:PilZ domain
MESTRKTPRYPFVSPADVVDVTSGSKMTAQVKELSLYGCYLDTPSPLPTRTKVTVKIYGSSEFFEAAATVIYANQMLGMGLVFRDVKPHYLGILRKWLLGAMQETQRKDSEHGEMTESLNESGAPEQDR